MRYINAIDWPTVHYIRSRPYSTIKIYFTRIKILSFGCCRREGNSGIGEVLADARHRAGPTTGGPREV